MELTNEYELLNDVKSRKSKNPFWHSVLVTVNDVYVKNIKSTKLLLPLLFFAILITGLWGILALTFVGQGGLGGLTSSTKALLIKNMIIATTLIMYIFLVIVMILVVPSIFKRNSKSIRKRSIIKAYGPQSYWGLILGKYIAFTFLLLTWIGLASIIFYLVVTIFAFGADNLYYLSKTINILVGGIMVALIWGTIMLASASMFSYNWQSTAFVTGFMFGILLLYPIQFITNIQAPTRQVVAVNTASAENGWSENTVTTDVTSYRYKDLDPAKYRWIYAVDPLAVVQSSFELAKFDIGNSDISHLEQNTFSLLSVPTKKVVNSNSPWFNAHDYLAKYPNFDEEIGGIVGKSDFAANGFRTKSAADIFGQETTLASPFGVEAVDSTYVVDFTSHHRGKQLYNIWMDVHNSGAIVEMELKRDDDGNWTVEGSIDENFDLIMTMMLHSLGVEHLWTANYVFAESTKYIDATGNTNYLPQMNNLDEDRVSTARTSMYDTPHASSYGKYVYDGINDINDSTSYTRENGEYATFGDMYKAWLRMENFNPWGTPDEEMFGNRAISSTVGHGGPPQELAMGIYSSFYAFAGMASSTRNVHLSPVEINDDLNYMNFMETVVGLQNLTMNMISETWNDNWMLVGDWNFYNSVSYYLTQQQELELIMTIPILGEMETTTQGIADMINVMLLLEGEDISQQQRDDLEYSFQFIGGHKQSFELDDNLLGHFVDIILTRRSEEHPNNGINTSFINTFINVTTDQDNKELFYTNDQLVDAYEIPATPPINFPEAGRRIEAAINGSAGFFNQSYYEVEETYYLHPIWHTMIWLAIAWAVFVPVSGLVIMGRNYR